jgi:putative MATE family efflux protein
VFACAACVLLVSTSVITARHNAAKDFVSLGRTIVLASSIAVASGITFAFLFLAFPHFFLSLLGASPALMSEAVPYLLWRASAFPAALFLLVAAGCFRGIGSPAETLRTGALVGAINLILDPLLMFYFGLGTAGAAIATAAAQWAGALSYIRIMFIRRKELGLNAGTLVRDVADQALPPPEPQAKKEKAPILMPRRRDVVDFMGAGSAMLFRSVLNVGAWTVMASAAARLGVFEIAAHQLVLSVWLVLAFFQEALGASGQVLVARTFGTTDSTGKPLEARSIAKRILTLSLLLGSSLAAAASVLMPPIIPFMCKSDEVVKLVRQALPVALSGLPLCCVVWSWDQVFYGAGDFRFNASVVAFASVTAVGVMTATMALGGGLGALWMTMIHFFFAIRLVGHVVRFNSHSGPFGRSTADLATAAATVPSA